MAQALPTAFVDDAAVSALGVRVPDASVGTGMSAGASNAPGIGISTENPGLEESLLPATDGSGLSATGPWTLLDQHGNARAGQIGQLLGGPGIVPRTGNQEFTWDKSQALYTAGGAASSGGQEGTLPDGIVRMGVNPDNVDGQPDNDDPITYGGDATLVDLAVGWTSV